MPKRPPAKEAASATRLSTRKQTMIVRAVDTAALEVDVIRIFIGQPINAPRPSFRLAPSKEHVVREAGALIAVSLEVRKLPARSAIHRTLETVLSTVRKLLPLHEIEVRMYASRKAK